MATVHPRIQVTPTDDLLAALERAAERWPGASRSELMVRLALAGDRSGIEQHARDVFERERALESLRALVGDLYDPDELARLRGEWRA